MEIYPEDADPGYQANPDERIAAGKAKLLKLKLPAYKQQFWDRIFAERAETWKKYPSAIERLIDLEADGRTGTFEFRGAHVQR